MHISNGKSRLSVCGRFVYRFREQIEDGPYTDSSQIWNHGRSSRLSYRSSVNAPRLEWTVRQHT
ncbi:hypothetical protein Halru_0417 [Halovivax ruber XH-70]|uniref:Uncharacterized protein n=1 Tax=Halovivax ruber (strain DSM 18193 / JCM 13892 / XH-70) TaxID=797302 RepID=L0I8M5_HALRX|nr:hypothetical protein Halru_0417 [Halovivax ruber XH-70]